MRFSVRYRVLGAFLTLWLVFVGSGLVWLRTLETRSDAYSELIERGKRHDLLVAVNLGVQQMVGARQNLRDGNASARSEFRALGSQTEQNLQALKHLSWSATDAELLQQAYKEFHIFQNRASAASPSQLVHPLETLLGADSSVQWAQLAELEQARTHITFLFAGCLLLALIAVMALSLVLTRSLTRPITRIEEATQPISEGDLSKRIPVQSKDEFGRLAERVNLMIDHLEGNFLGVAEAWARAVDEKSSWTLGHSHRVTQYALDTGQQLNLDKRTMGILKFTGLLHDIGKLLVPIEILDKPGKLTEEEFEKMKQHTVIGHRILSPIPFFKHMLEGVRHHHERYDGKGYPDELAGEQIPFLARLLAVADSYDAMTSDRPYRPGMPEEKALGILAEDNGKQWDIEMVEAFMRTRDPSLSHVREPSESLALAVPMDATPLTPAKSPVSGRVG